MDKWHRFFYGPDAISVTNGVRALRESKSTRLPSRKITLCLKGHCSFFSGSPM